MSGEKLQEFVQSVEKLFFRGSHNDVLRQTIDQGHSDLPCQLTHFVIGSLCFLGRLEEAEIFFRMSLPKLDLRWQVACRFFLIVGYARQSKYDKALPHIIDNFRLRKSCRNEPEARFYLFQGIGFYRFVRGQLSLSCRNAQRAFALAFEVNNLYGRLLSSELMGHCLIGMGHVFRGLKRLAEAQTLADLFENSQTSQVIQIQIATYRARYGMCSAPVFELEKLLSKSKPEDTYSLPCLLIEAANQHLLVGNPPKARDCLNRAWELVHGSENQRQALVIQLLYARIVWSGGDEYLAWQMIRSTKDQLPKGESIILLLETLMLEAEILIALKRVEEFKTKISEISNLNRRVGFKVAEKFVRRHTCAGANEFENGEDSISALKKLILSGAKDHIKVILESGYYSFLYEALSIGRNERTLYVDIYPGVSGVFDRGRVEIFAKSLTSTDRKLISLLAGGSKSKGEIIKSTWEYHYHPLKHDGLVYAAVANLRKRLGEYASWLVNEGDGYRFVDGIQVKRLASNTASNQVHDSKKVEAFTSHLNYRQLEILSYLDSHDYVSVKLYKEKFAVSEMTAGRDLSMLHSDGLVAKEGRARLTRYKKVSRTMEEKEYEM